MFKVEYIISSVTNLEVLVQVEMSKEEIAKLFFQEGVTMVWVEGYYEAYGKDPDRWHNNYCVGPGGLGAWLAFIGPVMDVNWADLSY